MNGSRWTSLALMTFAIMFATTFFGPEPAPPLLPPALSTPWASGDPKELRFDDVSAQWRSSYAHEQSSGHLTTLAETLGGGVCVIDANSDGWMDLFFVGGRGHTREFGRKSWWQSPRGNRLLLNRNGRALDDVTIEAGLGEPIWGMGCAVGDLDNDGLPDLIVTAFGGSRIYRNLGNTRFVDVTATSGMQADHWSTGASLADFNNDGFLDIYVSNYVLLEKGARTFERNSGFRIRSATGFDPTLYDPEANRLYVNRGGFVFEERAEELGVANGLGRSLGARWLYSQNHTRPELLVINDGGSPNQLFTPFGAEGFKRGSQAASALEIPDAHDVVVADFENRGRPQTFIARAAGAPPALLQRDDTASDYEDKAWAQGVASTGLLPFSGWGSLAADFNNDGWLDLYVAHGSTQPDSDSNFVTQGQPNALYSNDGRGRLRLLDRRGNLPAPRSSRGAAVVDLDNDGTLEIVVANNNDPLQILARPTRSAGHWLSLDLHQHQQDSSVLGAEVLVHTPDYTLRRQADGYQHFLSQSDRRIHFGLGKTIEVEAIEIRWPDGQSSWFRDVPIDRQLAVNRARGELKPVLPGETYSSPSPPLVGWLQESDTHDPKAIELLLRIYLAAADTEKAAELIQALWIVAPPEVRRAILEQSPSFRSSATFDLFTDSLSDDEESVVLAAVERMRIAEQEISVGWLIPLLDPEREPPNPNVQCASARAFEFFFNEEEAVTHRKWLALPYLIRLLEKGRPEAQICAADALAAAERKRAALALMELVGSSREDGVRAAAIRALGLVRDTRAIAQLEVMLDGEESNTSIAAASLIALVRLDATGVNDLAQELLAITDDPLEVLTALRFLNDLLASPDRVVLKRTGVLDGLDEKLDAARRQIDANVDLAPELSFAASRAIGLSQSPKRLEFALQLSRSPDASVRAEALIALASLGTAGSQRAFVAGLRRESPAQVRSVIEGAVRIGAAIPPDLLRSAHHAGAPMDVILAILDSLPHEPASGQLAVVLAGDLATAERLEILERCKQNGLSLRTLDPTLWKSPSPEVRTAYMACYAAGAHVASPDPKGQNALRRRMMIRDALSDAGLSEATKSRALITAAASDDVIARSLLAPRLSSMSDQVLPSALGALASSGAAPELRDLIWEVVEDEARHVISRVAALLALVPFDEREAIDYLERHELWAAVSDG